MTGNLSASILARLLTLAKQRGDDYNLLLNRFGMSACWPASARPRMLTAFCSRAPCSLRCGTTPRTARRGTLTCWALALTTRRT